MKRENLVIAAFIGLLALNVLGLVLLMIVVIAEIASLFNK
jgi:hypothetical protein